MPRSTTQALVGWFTTAAVLLVRRLTMLEKNLRRSKPAYAEYEARTSTFVPWPPKETVSA